MRFAILFLLIFTCSLAAEAQKVMAFQPDKTRILFLLDGSGSMREEWNGQSKFDLAKALLYNLVDSLQQENANVEFAIRIFGHQSPRAANNCKDSKLEVPFASSTSQSIKAKLESIKPQGHTPIAYSLYLAAQDFTETDNDVTNAIILITDGKENCEGDPCASSRLLAEKRISLRPFIVGLNIALEDQGTFDCVGTYYDTKDQAAFENVLNVVVSQAIKSTTAQVNLLNKAGKPVVTNIEFSLIDHYSGQVLYNFVHALDEEGRPDTLRLDPVGVYDLKVHTYPPVYKRGIELAPGKHNIIAADVPTGVLHTDRDKTETLDVQALVSEAYNASILYVQELNTMNEYLIGDYDVEVLTLPRKKYKMEYIPPDEQLDIVIPLPGKVTIITPEKGKLGIFEVIEDKLKLVFEFSESKEVETLELQPGDYVAVYRPAKQQKADLTQNESFTVEAGRNASVKFN